MIPGRDDSRGPGRFDRDRGIVWALDDEFWKVVGDDLAARGNPIGRSRRPREESTFDAFPPLDDEGWMLIVDDGGIGGEHGIGVEENPTLEILPAEVREMAEEVAETLRAEDEILVAGQSGNAAASATRPDP